MIKKVINSFLNLLFPSKCLGCGKENEILCPECLRRIDYPTLLKSNNILAATDYNDELAKKAIWLLKYRGIKQIAEPLAELIKQRTLEKIKIKNPVFIPIPLSSKRLKERGFNQSELIAKYLSDTTITNVLYKTKETVSQVSIKDREKRLNNLKGSFAVKNAELIKDKNIILIDDVSTTGATIAEVKRVLREAGAKNIVALVVARG
jgi:competence protein ComFC